MVLQETQFGIAVVQKTLLCLEKYAILTVQAALGRLAPSFSEGGGMMTVYEALTFAIAFATLIVLVITKKE